MRNQYMAKVLVHNKMATEEQINALWPQVSETKDIGMLLVEAGILAQALYPKVLAFVKNLEAKNAQNAPAAPQSEPKKNDTPPQQKPKPVTQAVPKVEPKVEVKKEVVEEPVLQIEGNNLYGESSSAGIEIEAISGLESTSIATIGISTATEEDDDEGELPTRFALASGEGTEVLAPENLTLKMNLKKIIAYARQFGATDIYLVAGRQIVMSQSGTLYPVTEDVLESTRITELLTEASEGFSDGYKVVVGKNFNKALALSGVGRIRIAVTWNNVIPSIAIRVIPNESASLENLYLPEFTKKFAELGSGLVLIAGPSSSGRTTTLTTFIETIGATRNVYIHAIGKPIERLLKIEKGVLVQKEVGLHVRSGIEGIEQAMRDGAGVICFDSLENIDELKLLLQGANAGALVFAVTSGNNIHALLSRLIASVSPDERAAFVNTLADQLKGVIVQHLIPIVDNQGLILAPEAMIVTSTISNMIRKGDLSQITAVINSQKDQGITLDDSLQKCVEMGYIDGSEAWTRAYDNRRFAGYKKG